MNERSDQTTADPKTGTRYVPHHARRTKARTVANGTFGEWVWSFTDGQKTVRWSLNQWNRWVDDNGAIAQEKGDV